MNIILQRISVIAIGLIAVACQAEPVVAGGDSADRSDRNMSLAGVGGVLDPNDGNLDGLDLSRTQSDQCAVGGPSAETFLCPYGSNAFETWLSLGDVSVVDGGYGNRASADRIEFNNTGSLIAYIRFQDIAPQSTISVSLSASGEVDSILALTVVEGCESLGAESSSSYLNFSADRTETLTVQLVATEAADCFSIVLNPLVFPSSYSVWNLQHSVD